MKTKLHMSILFLLLFGCKEQSTQSLPSDPYERWKAYNLHSYTIEQFRSCECVDGNRAVRIIVRSDTIAAVVWLLDSSVVPYPNSRWYLTVDSLFSIIRNNSKDSLVIQYHSQYGYPEKLDINPQMHPVDGGVLYETSNLQSK